MHYQIFKTLHKDLLRAENFYRKIFSLFQQKHRSILQENKTYKKNKKIVPSEPFSISTEV